MIGFSFEKVKETINDTEIEFRKLSIDEGRKIGEILKPFGKEDGSFDNSKEGADSAIFEYQASLIAYKCEVALEEAKNLPKELFNAIFLRLVNHEFEGDEKKS